MSHMPLKPQTLRSLRALFVARMDYKYMARILRHNGERGVLGESISTGLRRLAQRNGMSLSRLLVEYVMHCLPAEQRNRFLCMLHEAMAKLNEVQPEDVQRKKQPSSSAQPRVWWKQQPPAFFLDLLTDENYSEVMLKEAAKKIGTCERTINRHVLRAAEIAGVKSLEIRWMRFLRILWRYSTPHVVVPFEETYKIVALRKPD